MPETPMKSHSPGRATFRSSALMARALRHKDSDVLRLTLSNELFFIRDLDFLHLQAYKFSCLGIHASAGPRHNRLTANGQEP
jgi:hypothetical protein